MTYSTPWAGWVRPFSFSVRNFQNVSQIVHKMLSTQDLFIKALLCGEIWTIMMIMGSNPASMKARATRDTYNGTWWNRESKKKSWTAGCMLKQSAGLDDQIARNMLAWIAHLLPSSCASVSRVTPVIVTLRKAQRSHREQRPQDVHVWCWRTKSPDRDGRTLAPGHPVEVFSDFWCFCCSQKRLMGLNLKHAYRFAVEEQSLMIYRERCYVYVYKYMYKYIYIYMT